MKPGSYLFYRLKKTDEPQPVRLVNFFAFALIIFLSPLAEQAQQMDEDGDEIQIQL
jgi:hypothetical protein